MLANQLFIVLSPGSHFKEKVTLKLLILAHKMGNYNESFFKNIAIKKFTSPPPRVTSILCFAGRNTFPPMQDLRWGSFSQSK